MSLLRYRADLLSLAVVVWVLLLSLLPLYVSLSPLALLGLAGLLLFFKPLVSLVQHNHVHYAIFKARPLNIAFDLLLALTAGHLCAEWTLHHNIGHHGNTINSAADTSSVFNTRKGRFMHKLEYIVTGTLKIYPDCWRMAWQFYRQGKPRYLLAMTYETLFWLAIHAYFLSVNFWMAFCFVLLANLINRALVWLGAYWQHLHVPDTEQNTNMYAGPVFNAISFNIGYHISHHQQPTLHWSKLKAHTEAMLSEIPPERILARLP